MGRGLDPQFPPPLAYGGRAAAQDFGNFRIGTGAQQPVVRHRPGPLDFLGPSVWNAQSPPVLQDRVNRPPQQQGDLAVRTGSENCFIHGPPQFVFGTHGRDAPLGATQANRHPGSLDTTSQFLIGHGAQQLVFLVCPALQRKPVFLVCGFQVQSRAAMLRPAVENQS